MRDPRPQHENPVVRREVEHMLSETPSFRKLDTSTQLALADSLTRISSYLAGGDGAAPAQPLAQQLAPVDLRSRIGAGAQTPPAGAPQPSAPAGGAQPGAPMGGGSSQSTTGRAGEVARATLNAINFPEFVASLIQGTFQAIVDASIQQMEAYAELLKNVAGTVDQFMSENISDGTARDYLADQYDGFLARDTSSGRPRLTVNKEGVAEGEMPGFFKDLGFESPEDIDDQAVEQVIVPAARRTLAERRQQTLATMVLMGINRVVVDDGEITAKLQFHIDASETASLRFDQTKTTAGNISGRAGRNPFTANAIMVNTTSLNAQSDINVRADLTGQVKVRFRSETFPLERFADSYAIQLINQNARVPPPQQAAQTGMPPQQAAQTGTSIQPAQGTPAPVAPAPAAPARAPVAQSLADNDPWAPRSLP